MALRATRLGHRGWGCYYDPAACNCIMGVSSLRKDEGSVVHSLLLEML